MDRRTMTLDIRHLRAIGAIDETGSLSRAADRLNLTQSALSHQIKGLEQVLGLTLFLRSSKPLPASPTQAPRSAASTCAD